MGGISVSLGQPDHGMSILSGLLALSCARPENDDASDSYGLGERLSNISIMPVNIRQKQVNRILNSVLGPEVQGKC